ncbi:MAG TPA: hypothetical protein VNF73_12115 [Candidatus Saccharimonadales bacterium]|nr:hypothetical protein [Candidatus Saccharimonadales bacterium]
MHVSRCAPLWRQLLLLGSILVVAGCGSATGQAAPPPSAAPDAGGSSAVLCPTAPPAANLPAQWTNAASTPSVFPTIVSSQVTCGESRFLFSFTDTNNAPIAAPDRTANVAFYDLGRDPTKVVATAQGVFIWLIQGTNGIYVTTVNLPEAGDWGAEFTTAVSGGTPSTIRVRFQVQATSSTPVIGAKAPSTKTPTLADVGGDVKKIATDPNPDPAFYQVSEDQALAEHKPFVLIFATPKFCTSRVCGPTLDRLKAVASQYPMMTFINVEPYKLTYTNGQLQPVLDAENQLQPTQVTDAWGLLSEPWIFVVDGSGIVRGSFEAVAGDAELKAAITAAEKG